MSDNEALSEKDLKNRYLIEYDGIVCWRYPDESHRGISRDDVNLINGLLNNCSGQAAKAHYGPQLEEYPVKCCGSCYGSGDKCGDGRGCQSCRDTGVVPDRKRLAALKAAGVAFKGDE